MQFDYSNFGIFNRVRNKVNKYLLQSVGICFNKLWEIDFYYLLKLDSFGLCL
jgi:hypothetical protein